MVNFWWFALKKGLIFDDFISETVIRLLLTTVWTLKVKNTIFFDIIVQISRNSRLKLAKSEIVKKGPYFSTNFDLYKI